MPEVGRCIEIAVPIEGVFAYMADFRNALHWMHNFTRFEPLDGQYYGLGARVAAEGRLAGLPFRTVLEVVEFIPPRRLTSRTERGVQSISHWLFQPTSDGTEVCFLATYHPPGFISGVLWRLRLHRELERNAECSLLNLKRILEHQRRQNRVLVTMAWRAEDMAATVLLAGSMAPRQEGWPW